MLLLCSSHTNVEFRSFTIRWLTTTVLPFARVSHIPIKSQGKDDRSENVTLARDGREISLEAGLEKFQIFESESKLGPEVPMSEIETTHDWSISVAPLNDSTYWVDLLHSLSLRTNGHTVDFSPDGRHIAVAGSEIELFDVGTGQKILIQKDKSSLGYENVVVHAMSFSPNGQNLATAGEDSILRVCSPEFTLIPCS